MENQNSQGTIKPKKKQILRTILLIICLAVFTGSVIKISWKLYDYKHSQNTYNEIRQLVAEKSTVDTVTDEKPAVSTNETTTKTVENPVKLLLDTHKTPDALSVLKNKNAEFVFWISIPGTVMDYPVVKAADNDKYLYRDFYGSKSDAGCIFADFRNSADIKDSNTILYGHNMADSSMFYEITKYYDQDFYEKHKYITLDTLGSQSEWEVFSSYVTDVGFDYLKVNFPNETETQKFYDILKQKSIIKTDIKLAPSDKILTLSTCSYQFDNARTVLHARLMNLKK